MADVGVDSSVELHFAVDEPVGMIISDFVDTIVNFVEIGIFATATIGGIREQGNFGLLSREGGESIGGIFD